MDSEKKKKKKKGAYGKVLGFCVLASCAALVLAFFGGNGFGFGGGSGFGFGGPGGTGNGTANGTNGSGYSQGEYVPGASEGNDNENNVEDNNDGVINEEPVNLTIRVSGNNIYHDQDEVTSYELIRLFEQVNQPGLIWELVDDQAIHDALVNVRALMNENGINFVER